MQNPVAIKTDRVYEKQTQGVLSAAFRTFGSFMGVRHQIAGWLAVSVVLLMGCRPAQDSSGSVKPKELSWQQAFTPSSRDDIQKVATLQGTLVYKESFGPPNYGETPRKDSLSKHLVLDMPVSVGIEEEDIENPTQTHSLISSYIQLAGGFNFSEVSKLVGQKVEVKGKLFGGTPGTMPPQS